MKSFAAIDFETANQHRSSVCSVGVVTIDGEKNVPILATDRVVIRKSDLKLKLALLHNRNFYKLLNEKLKERDF